jgi:hypothetical protein
MNLSRLPPQRTCVRRNPDPKLPNRQSRLARDKAATVLQLSLGLETNFWPNSSELALRALFR